MAKIETTAKSVHPVSNLDIFEHRVQVLMHGVTTLLFTLMKWDDLYLLYLWSKGPEFLNSPICGTGTYLKSQTRLFRLRTP